MVNENKWGLLYCPRGGWRSNKRWEKIEKVLKQQSVDYDFVQSENQKSVEPVSYTHLTLPTNTRG